MMCVYWFNWWKLYTNIILKFWWVFSSRHLNLRFHRSRFFLFFFCFTLNKRKWFLFSIFKQHIFFFFSFPSRNILTSCPLILLQYYRVFILLYGCIVHFRNIIYKSIKIVNKKKIALSFTHTKPIVKIKKKTFWNENACNICHCFKQFLQNETIIFIKQKRNK